MTNASFEETRKIKHQGHGVCLLVVNGITGCYMLMSSQ